MTEEGKAAEPIKTKDAEAKVQCAQRLEQPVLGQLQSLPQSEIEQVSATLLELKFYKHHQEIE